MLLSKNLMLVLLLLRDHRAVLSGASSQSKRRSRVSFHRNQTLLKKRQDGVAKTKTFDERNAVEATRSSFQTAIRSNLPTFAQNVDLYQNQAGAAGDGCRVSGRF